MRETTIDRAQQGPLEAWSRFNPFNNPVRNVEMKSTDRKILILVASLALLLAGCGGGSTPATPPAPPPPTAYEIALTAIEAATTAEAAQAAYDNVKDDVTAAEGDQLQMAVDERQAALATMARADAQKTDLMAAAGMVDTSDLSTQEKVDAAREAIAGLRQAIADAVDVPDTSMYQSTLDDAIAAVDEAQGGIDTATRGTNQMAALSDASGMLQTALAALFGSTPTQAQLDAANAAVTALNEAIAAGMDLTEAEKATYVREAANAAAPIDTAQMAFDDAEAAAQDKADMEMTALAAKLYAAMDPIEYDSFLDQRFFKPLEKNGNDTGLATNPGFLTVQSLSAGGGGHPLEEEKTAMVAPLNGWKGSRHTATVATGTSGAGTYTARMYSDVGEPTQGPKFNAGPGTTGVGFALVDNRVEVSGPSTIIVNGSSIPRSYPNNLPERIASPQFDHTAGDKTFSFPDPNPSGETIINIPGSYYGVEGTYNCEQVGTGACTVTKASGDGYVLGGENAWYFRPDNPEDRVTSLPDTVYPVYGWWLHETPDGTATVSPFTSYRGGTVTEPSPEAAILITGNQQGFLVNPLFGTATYKGGAAGIYAISADADNDAGHFTADAELTATFNGDGFDVHKITGTIDSFVGSDGMSRDWSVELKQISIAGRNGSFNTPSSLDGKITTWSMGGTAAGDSGEWNGTLYKKNDADVPTVGTGMFYSEYENIGRMTGAFGVNLEE